MPAACMAATISRNSATGSSAAYAWCGAKKFSVM